jgi:Tol biopolymer transport system component/tRNA A-37 threonylcarbamoyl transferase component Bud32
VTLASGTRLGPYELLASIGAGGMGEVYRARDTRLERTVAVKVLPSHLAASAESRQRFEREARTISQLSHPHICALYDVGREGETEYLVMEYLEGETLSDRLLKGALPFEQVLRFGTEIADALDKAHRSGVVHRDLKPGNVMLTKSGVKLLDFGLAKAMAVPGSTSGASLTALQTQMGSNLTQEGTILGTFQYMAPEQLEGKEADARTDIFAFGTLLYEMATGRKAFSGGSQASLISSIMGSEPAPISTVAPMTPPAFDRVVRTCLAKDPDDRWQTAHDVGVQLKWIQEGGSAAGLPAPVAARRKSRERLAWAIAGLFALIAALATAGYLRRAPKAPQAVRASILPPSGTLFEPIDGPVALSPDGRQIAFSAKDAEGDSSIWVRSLDSPQAQKLEGTRDSYDPFWSPDGRFVGYGGNGLFKFEVPGGPAQKIADMADGRGCSWNRDNVILFAKSGASPLFRVSASGGPVEQVTRLDKSRGEIGHWRPQFLPDGKHFLYLARCEPSQNSGIYVGSLDSRETKRVADIDVTTSFAPPGFLLFIREKTLMAQPFDSKGLRVAGEPVVVGRDVQYVATWGSAAFATSDNGVLAYQGASPAARQLVWFDRSGKRISTLGPDSEYADDPHISPDGSRVAIKRLDPATRSNDLWILDVSRGIGSRFTFDPARESDPVWSAGGDRLFFSSNKAGIGDLYEKAASGAGSENLLLKSDLWKEPLDVSSDGRWLLYRVRDPKNARDIWLLSLSGDRKATPLLATPFDEDEGRFSQDGRWLAYKSNETGKPEVFVQPFPPTGQKWQVSTSGGSSPRWTSGGRELVYFEPPDKCKLVEIRTAPSFQVSVPKDLFTTPRAQGSDVARDGQRLLINLPAAEVAPNPMTIVLNWAAGLKK